MARPCYVYLKLKIPGPRGVITINGDKRIAQECEEGDKAIARAACIAESATMRESQENFDDIMKAKGTCLTCDFRLRPQGRQGSQRLRAIANKDTSQASRVAISSRSKIIKSLHHQAGHSGLKISILVATQARPTHVTSLVAT